MASSDIRPNEGLAVIDWTSRTYVGQTRQRRFPREVFVIEIDGLRHFWAWGG